jgi:hypothetical protein
MEINLDPVKSKRKYFFTVKSVKQVRVKQFKTTGLDYKVQFHDVSASDFPDVLRRCMKCLKAC